MDIQYLHQLFLKCSSVSIDTRKIEFNSLFIAIKGERFDANAFAVEALSKGAKYVIIDNKDYYIDDRTVLVADSLKALQELSRYHRSYLNLKIIALTGSNGKTTTKELVNCVLSKKFTTKATIGNYNNHIGVPLTLLSFDQLTEIGIIEMGANHQKEIEFLCDITQPDFGYITNFGKAHLEGFGGIEGVIIGKSEIYNYLRENNKTVFINVDDHIQVEKSINIKKFTFGLNNSSLDVNITEVVADPMVKVTFDNTLINSNLIGIYNSNNINAAIAIGKYFKIENELIKEAIENYIPENNRSQLINKNGNEIILDAYNANPSSMHAAILNFIQLKGVEKVAILGDMFELGDESMLEHRKVVELLSNEGNITTYFVGKCFNQNQLKKEHFNFFENLEVFLKFLEENKPTNSMLLIKGSRGMALEKILQVI